MPALKPIAGPPFTNDADPPLDYAHYTIDFLIQGLVPTNIYLPKVRFAHSTARLSDCFLSSAIISSSDVTLFTNEHSAECTVE